MAAWSEDRVAEERYAIEEAARWEAENEARWAAIDVEHDFHAAKGENHWVTCPLCDDEAEDA